MKVLNLNSLLEIPKINDYLDLVISFWDGVLLVLILILIVNFIRRLISNISIQSLREKVAYWGIGLGFLLVIIICLVQISSLTSYPELWHYGTMISRVLAWIYLITHYKTQRIIWIILGIFSVFDHFLISQSLPVLLIWFLIWLAFSSPDILLSRQILVIRAFGIYLIINGILAIFQFISGHSLGLSWIGESVLDIKTVGGIAKQNILGHTFLRGYGLLPHPNMTGFLGVIGLLYTNRFTSKKLQQTVWKTSLQITSIVLIVLSFSRATWITGLVVTGVSNDALFGWWKRNTPKNYWCRLLIPVSLMSISVFALTLTRNDLYRTNDLQLWFDSFLSLDIWHKLFGIGFGQYPFYLKSHHNALEPWQWQPVHNIWLNLIIEGGLVLFVLGIVLGLKIYIGYGFNCAKFEQK